MPFFQTIGIRTACLVMTFAGTPAIAGQHVHGAPGPSTAAAAEGPAIGAPFLLRGTDGRPLTDKTFRGEWLIAFFGYTSCPDVCPTTLTTLTKAFAAQDPVMRQVRALFVTLDPRRDTPAMLGRYMTHFSPRITAATGSRAQVDAAARAFRVRYEIEGDVARGAYTVSHPVAMLLFNPQGRFVSLIPGGATAADVRATVAAFIRKQH